MMKQQCKQNNGANNDAKNNTNKIMEQAKQGCEQ